jgi:hypothetical protein
MTLTRDTSAAARDIQIEALRRLDGPTRFRLALEMSEEARQVTLAGIQHRHPDWTDAAVHRELLRLLLGGELASAVLERARTRP